MHVFKRNLRMREHGALCIPVTVSADVFRFDLQDIVCDITYDEQLFSTFERARHIHNGASVIHWIVPRNAVKQVEYMPMVLKW